MIYTYIVLPIIMCASVVDCNHFIEEVTVDYRSRILQCGVETLLCSIKLNNPSAKFTNRHSDCSQIIREVEDEFCADEWVRNLKLQEGSSGNVLDVFCLATEPGRATVKLDLGRWYKFVDESEFPISVPCVEWIPEFEDLIEQPVFLDDDHFKCLIQFLPQAFSPNDVTVCYYQKHIANVEVEILRPDVHLQASVPLKNIRISEKGKAQFKFTVEKIPMLLNINFTVYQTFDEESCKMIGNKYRYQKGFQCENVSAHDIEGEDRCHLNNIERVCCIEKVGIHSEPIHSNVRVILPELCDVVKVEKCRKILLHLLRAIYYRKKASETDKERIKWKEKAMETYAANNRKHSSFCKHIKTKYADLMQQYNDEASKEIFAFFNEERGLNHVDLHGLLVVNEETLARDKEQLLKDNPEEEVITIINKRRNQGDEAVRKLKGKIDEFMEKMEKAQSEKKTWLEVIVGAGHHSMAGRQKIRPKVETFLQEEYPGKISVVNKGALVVTFEEYPNGRRCFGHYYCQTCKNSWRSGKSFKNKWQGCFKCHRKRKGIKECLPVMQQPLQKSELRGGAGGTFRHIKQLCQVCKEGGSCTT